ncbi:hypothetical protein MKX03_004727 [Papaver bracteatum]|nr:hypothetical protein MKX03_004727 [Papaver bracteatum]
MCFKGVSYLGLEELLSLLFCLAVCKKCIYQKLDEGLTNCCPLCNEYLGSCPKEKLRPDNNLQELKNKIFPSKKARDVKSTETPATQRKATLASLPPKTRRTKANVKTTKVSAKNDNLEKIKEKNHPGTTAELETSTKTPVVYNKQRIKSVEESSRVGKKSTHKHAKAEKLSVPAKTSNGRDDINGPLLSLPEVCLDKEEPNKKIPTRAKRKSRKSIPFKSPGLVDLNMKLESEPETETNPKERSQRNTSDVPELQNSREQRFGASTSKGLEQEPLTRSYPVWFTLHACENKRGESYPQIPKPYIKINDGNMPVSSVQKYLVQKLNLIHESEVEVMCCGQPLDPIATLNSITQMWVKNTNGHIRIKSSETQNFIMVLTYRKK